MFLSLVMIEASQRASLLCKTSEKYKFFKDH